MQNAFIHLRNHTSFSVGSSTLKIKEIPKLCQKFGMFACAITDTNLMSGTAEFSDVMPKNKLLPIIGIEISLNHHNADPKTLRSESLSKIVLLAQNQSGYENLCTLTRLMYMRGENNHLGAYVTFSELKDNSENLICLSGGHLGPIGMCLLQRLDSTALDIANDFKDLFGDRFYMEIQRHGLADEIKTEPDFLRIAKDLNIPIVATNDVCFAETKNYEAQDVLMCVLNQRKVIDPERPRKSSQQYFKSGAEMAEIFSDLPEAIENTVIIAKRCSYMVNVKQKPLLPKIDKRKSSDAEEQELKDKVFAGLEKRLNVEKITDKDVYVNQAHFELEVIINSKFAGYFLIVADYIEWCRKNDILVGPGRGSGAGSIVAWALGITNVNPLKYGLLFERFLNPDRVSMPDFDVDFEPSRLEDVWRYVRNKYGEDSVCRIITFGTLQARGAIRDVGRVYGIPYPKTDRLSKLIPGDAKNLQTALDASAEIRGILHNDKDLKKVVDIAQELEGALRNLGQHACGVVIGDRPTAEIAPVYRDPNNDMPSSQFDGHYLEATGLIKFDFLGLETLAILKYACQLILQNRGIKVDLDAIPTDDKKTMELWQRGLTEGIFQFDADFVQQTLRKMKPTSFLEISALNALNRPGPIANIPSFIARMHGDEKIEYVHERAESVLKETYGIIVYQEQVMQLVRELAGFTRGESDTVRKAMGKKIIELMNEMELKFIEGCKTEGTLKPDVAKKLWEQFKEFAKYAFNKSHAIAYSLVANQSAYLKALYTPEFLAAAMSSNLSNTEQLAILIDDAKNNFGIEVIAPDINTGDTLFTVKNGKIVYGLAAIKGVGKEVTRAIINIREEGKFKNITDFAKRCAGVLNKRVLEAFIKVGALDCLEKNRGKLYMNADAILAYSAQAKSGANQASLFEVSVEDDVVANRLSKNMVNGTSWTFEEKMAGELSALGFYISAHPLDKYKPLLARRKISSSADLNKKKDREIVEIAVNVNSFSKRRTKAGKDMITINASDSFGNVDIVAFGDNASEFNEFLKASDKLVIITGRISNRDDSVSIFADAITDLTAWARRVADKMTLVVKDKAALPKIKDILDKQIRGKTKVVLKIFGDKNNVLMPTGHKIEISENTTMAFSDIGVKAEIE